MEVEQKHITTIRMHDAKGSEVCLHRDGQDYHLKMVSSDNIVNIVLGHQDIRKLALQIVQLDIQENWRPHIIPTPPEPRSFFFGEEPRTNHRDAMSDWFVRMAKETNHEKCSR